ncbi:MAG: hypothetical protein HY644_00960 [Acidobacteria bacterium]|nr:hypothetical protein [Acidobacteriota bacterium]
MKKHLALTIFILLLLDGFQARAEAGDRSDTSVRDRLLRHDLPARIKAKKKIARWDQIDAVLNQTIVPRAKESLVTMKIATPTAGGQDAFSENATLDEELGGNRILFSDLFQINEDNFFPLTNSVLKFVPESSLESIEVLDRTGQILGTFAGKSRYEKAGGLYSSRSSYVLITFQYKTAEGEIRSAGNDNLLDNFLVHWRDIRSRPALDLSVLVSP